MTSKDVGGGASFLSGEEWNQLPAVDPGAWLGRQSGRGEGSQSRWSPRSKNQLGCPCNSERPGSSWGPITRWKAFQNNKGVWLYKRSYFIPALASCLGFAVEAFSVR